MEDEIRQMEESLWRPETRFDRSYMAGVLADDFLEFGRSGRRYDRDAALNVDPAPFNARLPLPHFVASCLAADVVLVTYVSEVTDGSVERANRSSVWVREGDSWRLRFHQGTPTSGQS